MAVDTKRVSSRRQLHFDSLDEVLADAEQMASRPVELLGNWSQGQIYMHVATVMQQSIDGLDFEPPWYLKIIGRLFLKGYTLKKGFPAGFQLPENTKLRPSETSVEEGLAALRAGIERLKRESTRAISPLLGRMTAEEWNLLHQRHAELHFSFIVPA